MIREKVSTILNIPIRSGRWVTYTESLDREGKFTRKVMLDIIMALCEEVESLESQIELLRYKGTGSGVAGLNLSDPSLEKLAVNQPVDLTKFETPEAVRKEEIKQNRIAALARAREAKKAKKNAGLTE